MANWKSIPGYEGAFEVSDDGQVRSVTRTVNGPNGPQTVQGRVRKLHLSTKGYPSINLRHNGKSRTHRVHNLVLEAFVGKRPAGMQGLHANDDRLDNRVENLRWGTPSDNRRDEVRNGRNPNAAKTHCKRGHPFSPANTYVNVVSGSRQCRACMRAAARR